MTYFCCDERRRNAVRGHPVLNGIDFLDVLDDPSQPLDDRQRFLFVHFANPVAPGSLEPRNVRIEGGERIRNITVLNVAIASPFSPLSSPVASPLAFDPRVVMVEVSARGDFSRYRLCLVDEPGGSTPPANIDPELACIEFSFKVNCPSDFDCRPVRTCADAPAEPPEINYLAKDYATFRQLLLDRMAVVAPAWKERNAADLGVALVELAAYVGDHLSYQQDAIVTESYIGKARRRASVRRHARLVDYAMHDGRNARVWVQIVAGPAGDGLTVTADEAGGGALHAGTIRNRTKLLTRTDALSGPIVALPSPQFAKALSEKPVVFELLHDLTLRIAHNEMRFYTHGAGRCCLPKGATRAVLTGSLPDLHPGDWIVLVEKRGPETGVSQDADPAHRHVVRLTSVTTGSDPLGGRFADPPDQNPRPITTIEWGRADALPFPLCVSSIVNGTPIDDTGVALGNIVLADHGLSVSDVPLPMQIIGITTSLVPDTVPAENPALVRRVPSASSRCDSPDVVHAPLRYRPRLTAEPITQAAPFDRNQPPASASAATDLSFEDPSEIPVPAVALFDQADLTVAWTPVRDLLASGPLDTHFSVEVETDRTTFLRFGNGTDGMAPSRGHRFFAEYRIGNGVDGNVGAGTIRHLASHDPVFATGTGNDTVARIWNPLPATGGVEPESAEHARQHAPSAFRRLERAVTPADYATLAVRKDVTERCDLDVQRAEGTLRWTGSWYTVFLTVDRFGGAFVDDSFERDLRNCLERYRMAGQDLEVDAPRFVPLEIEMVVCVRPPYFYADVERALVDVFSNRTLPDGRRGLFHPDNFTFGQSVHLSAIYAAAQAVPGVDSLVVTTFQRQGIDSDTAIESGTLTLDRLEIARLDADANFPDRGVLRFKKG